MNSLIRKYKNLSLPLKASFFFILCSFIQKSISIITSPIFTRLLSVEDYGKCTLFNSWTEVLSIFVTFKIMEAVFNKTMVSVDDYDKKKVLSTFQVVLTLLFVIFCIIYLIFYKQINGIMGFTSSLMIAMIINIYFDGTIKLWIAFQRYEYKYIILVIVSIIISLMNPLIGIFAVMHLKDKVFARILGIIIPNILIGIIIFIYNIKNINIYNVKKIGISILLFNLPLLPHYLSQILLNHSDRIMIGRMQGESAVAFYGVAYTIGMLITMITQSINSAYTPSIYRSIKKKEIKRIINVNYKLLCFVSLLILTIFMVIPEIVLIFGGRKYIESTYSVYPITVSVLFIFMYTLFANIELYYGIRKYVTIGTCLSAIFNIILNFIFIQKFGYIAAGYTTLICYICYGFFHIFISKQIICKNESITVKYPINRIILLSGVLILLSFLCQLLVNYIIIRYLILIIIIVVLLYKRDKIIVLIKEDIT